MTAEYKCVGGDIEMQDNKNYSNKIRWEIEGADTGKYIERKKSLAEMLGLRNREYKGCDEDPEEYISRFIQSKGSSVNENERKIYATLGDLVLVFRTAERYRTEKGERIDVVVMDGFQIVRMKYPNTPHNDYVFTLKYLGSEKKNGTDTQKGRQLIRNDKAKVPDQIYLPDEISFKNRLFQ
jgi:hypothetical protein